MDEACGDEAISSEDIQRCAAVLKRMTASDLLHAEFAAIREAGMPVFRRVVLKERFGSEDVLGFLKQKSDVHQMTTKLQRLHKVVKDEHEERRRKAETCGMNLRRKADLAAIKAESQLPEALSIADLAEEHSGEAPLEDIDRMLKAPVDSFYSNCNMCRGQYIEHHHFYHQLCPRCAEHNWEKRNQKADMTGMVCVVTGGRVRIGYKIVLKLLRSGAFVLTTTRYPNDCAWRFSQEDDYEDWRHRLEVCGPLELCDIRLVEHFCDQLIQRFERIHVLINNAAQTLTRQKGWNVRMTELESTAALRLHSTARGLEIRSPERIGDAAITSGSEQLELARTRPSPSAPLSALWKETALLEDFPEGELDESRQPLDRSMTNSWSRRIESAAAAVKLVVVHSQVASGAITQVGTVELLQTLAANTAAPFILCSRLAGVIGPKGDGPYGHIVNVSALEGKFSVKNKSSGHPHTNMAKAALNMMTHTASKDMFRRRILMNCVDTGWVTDMAPDGVGTVAATHETWIGPPLDEEGEIVAAVGAYTSLLVQSCSLMSRPLHRTWLSSFVQDGAARVLDPLFSHLKDPTWLLRGKFFKNYYVCGW